MTNEKNQKLIEYHRNLQFQASLEAYKCTCHFLKINNELPSPLGTGVFVKIDNQYFVFTAAHVIEDFKEDIYVGLENNLFHRLGGVWNFNELPDGKKRENDKLDIGILLLDKVSVERIIEYYEFLDYSEIELNHIRKSFPVYTALGYPASTNRLNTHKLTIKSKPFILHTIPCQDPIIYKKLQCNPKTNFLVFYNKKRIFEHKNKKLRVGPDPYGMSGGGLWYVKPQIVSAQDKVSKKLIAIMTEWPIKNKNVLICTKIDVFIEAINNKCLSG